MGQTKISRSSLLPVVETVMAAKKRGGSDAGGRRPSTAARRRAFLFIAVISTFIHQHDARFVAVPQVDDSTGWTYEVDEDDNVDWRPAVLVTATQTANARPSTESPWRRPVNAVYSRHRQRTQSNPNGRFIAGSALKRRSM